MYSIREIKKILTNAGLIRFAQIKNDDSIEILLSDSRSLSDAKKSLFFALSSNSGDGHKYIEKLYQAGLRSFVLGKEMRHLKDLYANSNILEVNDTLAALQAIAKAWRDSYQTPIVGITGSNGKTIIKEYLYQVLRRHHRVLRSPRSYNSQIGVPLSVWQLSQEHELAIFEAGISKPGEMQKLEPIIRPDIGILSNIGSSHLENFSNQVQILAEKLRLFIHSKWIIYQADNEMIALGIHEAALKAKAFTWSYTNKAATLYISSVQTEGNSSRIYYTYEGQNQMQVIPFADAASIENCIHCIAAIALIDKKILLDPTAFSDLEPVDMRLELKAGSRGNTLINDVYSNDLSSLSIALDFHQRRSDSNRQKRVLILSDMLQSGIEADLLYTRIAKQILGHGLDCFIGIGPSMMKQQEAFTGIEAHFYPDTDSFIASGRIKELQDSCILVKGARIFKLESIIQLLSEQDNQTSLQINLSAIVHNLNYYKSLIPASCKIICMIKAQAYGVGSFELAKTLQEHHVDYLAVALADEGKELRMKGIYTPIIVMNPERNALHTLLEYRLEPEIYSFDLLREYQRAYLNKGAEPMPIHIKIDSGMHRLGFADEELEQLATLLEKMPELRVASIFSHLAAADDLSNESFTLTQISKFQHAYSLLSQRFGYNPLAHILNTAGIEAYPQYALDMVRLGIGLYGISSTNKAAAHLNTVATLQTSILQVKNVKAGESVGYSRKGHLSKDSKIAIIPIGYADGLDRRLSCGVGEVYIAGTRCPIVGNICMDTTMVDVSHIETQAGDEVIIFGKEIGIDEIAQKMNTIAYEVLTNISPRVRRIYYRE